MGNVYVCDPGNRTIRRITPAGQVSTLTLTQGDGGLVNVGYSGLAVDAAGNLYVSYSSYNQHKIFKINPAGNVSLLAGSIYGPFYAGSRQIGVNVDGPRDVAAFFEPSGLAVDLAGNVIVADTGNNTVRRIAPDGTVTTVAGHPNGGANSAGYVDGPATTARFTRPASVAVDAGGSILVADLTTIRRISPDGTVTTIAGSGGQSGSADGIGSAARFIRPRIALDATNRLFIADEGGTVRKLTADGTVTTIAGLAGQQGITDGVGSAARFISPSAVLPADNGSVLVVDRGSADGVGPAAHFFAPLGVAIKGDGSILITEELNSAVRIGRALALPVILTQPGNQSVTAGANVTFTVAAAGYPAPAYQWYFNNVAISGATSVTLTLSNVTSANAGTYTVAVFNSLGSVISNQAALSIITSLPPPASSGSGGGGGAPSAWFLAMFIFLGLVRRLRSGRRSVWQVPVKLVTSNPE